MKVMNYPNKNVDAPNYLLETIDENNIALHRGLKTVDEINHYQNRNIIEYLGKKYLSRIATFPSLEDAEATVRSYWGGVESLFNSIPKKDSLNKENVITIEIEVSCVGERV